MINISGANIEKIIWVGTEMIQENIWYIIYLLIVSYIL